MYSHNFYINFWGWRAVVKTSLGLCAFIKSRSHRDQMSPNKPRYNHQMPSRSHINKFHIERLSRRMYFFRLPMALEGHPKSATFRIHNTIPPVCGSHYGDSASLGAIQRNGESLCRQKWAHTNSRAIPSLGSWWFPHWRRKKVTPMWKNINHIGHNNKNVVCTSRFGEIAKCEPNDLNDMRLVDFIYHFLRLVDHRETLFDKKK